MNTLQLKSCKNCENREGCEEKLETGFCTLWRRKQKRESQILKRQEDEWND